MADIKEAFGSLINPTVTNLSGLGNSATAGWKSAAIDNSTNLYLDYLVQLTLTAVNTAPANNQAIYLFVSGLVDSTGTAYAGTGAAAIDGNEGAVTFPTILGPQNLLLLGIVPYITQNVAINSEPFSVADAFGGFVPQKFCLAAVNYSGMTLGTAVLNVKGLYRTVA